MTSNDNSGKLRALLAPAATLTAALGTAMGTALPAVAQQPILEEIIVTAQKRVENVQDIPVTINVITGE